MIKQSSRSHNGVLGFEFTGRVEKSDYANLVPLVDQTIARYGCIRLLIHFNDFKGWDLGGFWRDFKFSISHRDGIERVAAVGEADWQKVLIELAKPLEKAEVRYFESPQLEEAWRWIENDLEPSARSPSAVSSRGN